MSTLEPGIVDILLRSRHTICEILEDRGYNSDPYRNIAPEQISILAAKPHSMDMTVDRRRDDAPCDRAMVIYMTESAIAPRFLESKMSEYDLTGAVDMIVILNQDDNEAFDQYSLKVWREHKQRITFFHIKQLVIHLGRHVLVPPHRKLTDAESRAEMDRYSVTQKTQFPLIKHSDIQARLMGLVPGDIVEVLRPSPTAGVARVLRICAA